MSQWVNGSMGQLMGQWVGWVLGQWVNGSWVSDTMGQMGHGSPMVTHGIGVARGPDHFFLGSIQILWSSIVCPDQLYTTN